MQGSTSNLSIIIIVWCTNLQLSQSQVPSIVHLSPQSSAPMVVYCLGVKNRAMKVVVFHQPEAVNHLSWRDELREQKIRNPRLGLWATRRARFLLYIAVPPILSPYVSNQSQETNLEYMITPGRCWQRSLEDQYLIERSITADPLTCLHARCYYVIECN